MRWVTTLTVLTLALTLGLRAALLDEPAYRTRLRVR